MHLRTGFKNTCFRELIQVGNEVDSYHIKAFGQK